MKFSSRVGVPTLSHSCGRFSSLSKETEREKGLSVAKSEFFFYVIIFGGISSLDACPILSPTPHYRSKSPKQSFHQETLEEATRQLRAVAPELVHRVASFGPAALDETPNRWKLLQLSDSDHAQGSESKGVAGGHGEDESRSTRAFRDGNVVGVGLNPGRENEFDEDRPYPLQAAVAGIAGGQGLLSTLLPSVRCGVEMASGTAIGPALSVASGLPARSSIDVNGLAVRGKGLTGGRVRARMREKRREENHVVVLSVGRSVGMAMATVVR